jgi:hypothetical protein
MEKTQVSTEPEFADHTSGIRPELPSNSSCAGKIQSYASTKYPSTPPSTTQRADTQHTFENMACTSIRQPRKTAIPAEFSEPNQTKVVPSLSRAASRRSDQRPRRGCNNDGLEVVSNESESRPKRHSCQSRPAGGAGTSRKVKGQKSRPPK